MARKLKSDKLLFTATLLLVCTSIVMVYSASAVIATEKWQDPYRFLFKQAAWVLIGLSLVPIVMHIDYRSYRQPAVIWSALGIAGFALVAVLFSSPVNGASRWLHIGPLGVQPSELAKIAIILFTAALLERRMDRIDELPYALLPIGVTTGVIVGLILVEPDLGTAVSVLVIAGAMVFAAGISYRYILALALVAIPAFYVVVMAQAYRVHRMLAFLDPWSDPQGKGYQVIQSMIAVGTGGFFGTGLMGGIQKLFYLPEAHTDFLLAVVGEELGFAGVAAIIALFTWLTMRAFSIGAQAAKLERYFSALVAQGIAIWLSVQSIINMGVNVGLLPTKGLTLPFLSFGGSGVVANCCALALLLRIDWESRQMMRGKAI